MKSVLAVGGIATAVSQFRVACCGVGLDRLSISAVCHGQLWTIAAIFIGDGVRATGVDHTQLGQITVGLRCRASSAYLALRAVLTRDRITDRRGELECLM